MGMYTELRFASELKKNIPDQVVNVLKYMVGNKVGDKVPVIPHHPLFNLSTQRWKYMLMMDSYYFDADTHSTLRYDKISESFYLTIQCNLKNYEDEIENFIDWIMPYLEKEDGEYLGHMMYEEATEPTHLYFKRVETS